MPNNLIQSFFVEGIPPLPNRTRGQHWSKSYREKKEWENRIGWIIKANHIKPMPGRVHIHYTIQVGTNQVDPDNVAFAVTKIANDALQKMAIIKGDDIGSVELSYAFMRVKPKGFEIRIESL